MVTRSVSRTAVVLLERDALLRLQRVRLHDRLRARLRAGSLDRELAGGASPESSIDLALHAAHLCGSSQRRVLACTLSRIAVAADTRGPLPAAPVCRSAVERARPELAAVVDRLAATGPVGVGGLARLRCLLADGSGPLYRASAPGRLRCELASALAALEPSA